MGRDSGVSLGNRATVLRSLHPNGKANDPVDGTALKYELHAPLPIRGIDAAAYNSLISALKRLQGLYESRSCLTGLDLDPMTLITDTDLDFF